MNLGSEHKLSITSDLFKESNINIDKYYLFPSSGYRMRCEFSYNNFSYIMFDGDRRIKLTVFNKAHPSIQRVMPILLDYLKNVPTLTKGLFQINFRTNGEITLTSFIYRKNIPESYLEFAKQLELLIPIKCLARSKNKIICTSDNQIHSKIYALDKNYILQHSDNSFFQPNYYSLAMMLEFINNNLNNCDDLLELYCGCGSFSIPLSNKFKNVFVSDNNRDNIINLITNIKLNNINNISFGRISDDEFSQAISGRKFNRLKGINLQNFNFSHVIVDPPRSGLHDSLIHSLDRYKNIIYVSCNPETFIRDVGRMVNYRIKSLALFDQFANTSHLEVIGILEK